MVKDVATNNAPRPGLVGLWLVHSNPTLGGNDEASTRLLDVNQGMVVGSSASADVRLADRYMSRRHFRIDWARGWATVEDLGSTNGTYVNGVAIVGKMRVQTPAVIRAGLREFSVFDAVATPAGIAVGFGRVLGQDSDMASLFHRLLTASLESSHAGRVCREVLKMLCLDDESSGPAGYENSLAQLDMDCRVNLPQVTALTGR